MKVTDKIEITNEDNMLLMARYPDKYFDLAIVDPPYGIGEDGAKNHSRGKATRPTMYTSKNWDSSAPSKDYFIELTRVSKQVIIWGANHFIENIPNSNSSSWVVWDKQNGDNDFADCELAWTNHKTAVRKFALYKWLLDKYAKQGDKILDTHLGSGSIAIACHDYGFELTACELDLEYYEKAVERINNHVAQLKLF